MSKMLVAVLSAALFALSANISFANEKHEEMEKCHMHKEKEVKMVKKGECEKMGGKLEEAKK